MLMVQDNEIGHDESRTFARLWNGPYQRRSAATANVAWQCLTSGEGPRVLLIHGTGAAAHSWRDLGPALAQHFEVLAPDLPGHGDSQALDDACLSLDGMASSLAALLDELAFVPDIVVGHSAGAALAAQLSLAHGRSSRQLVSLNGAFLPYGGPAQSLLSPLAGLLANNRWVTRFVAGRARDLGAVDRLIRGTGSKLDSSALEAYQATLSSAERVQATLTMMARWRVDELFAALPDLAEPLHLVVGKRDSAVSPWQADRVRRRCPHAQLTEIDAVGHLMHEEKPEHIAALIVDDARQQGVLNAR